MKYAQNIRYQHDRSADFQKELRRRVDAYFNTNGGNRKANTLMWLKIGFYFVAFFSSWATLALFPHSLLTTSVLIIALGICFQCVAFNVAHDAVHGTLSSRPWINDLFYWISYTLLGPSAYLWKPKHNHNHHFFVNMPGLDADVEGTELMRMAHHRPWKPMHRFQHIYFAIPYMLMTLHWIFVKDFKQWNAERFGNLVGIKHSRLRLLELIFVKSIYVGYMIVVPAIMLPYSFGTVIAGFCVFHFVMSFWVSMMFVSSHISETTVFVQHDEEGRIPHSFIEHQLLTSVDAHAQSKAVGFFYGGFNSHVAHHIFPTICSIHYPALSKIIAETTKDYSMPYYEVSLIRLFISHFRILKTLGTSPESGAENLMSPTQEGMSA